MFILKSNYLGTIYLLPIQDRLIHICSDLSPNDTAHTGWNLHLYQLKGLIKSPYSILSLRILSLDSAHKYTSPLFTSPLSEEQPWRRHRHNSPPLPIQHNPISWVVQLFLNRAAPKRRICTISDRTKKGVRGYE